MNELNRRGALALSLAAVAPMGWAQGDWPARSILLTAFFNEEIERYKKISDDLGIKLD